MRQIKQLNLEREAIEGGREQNDKISRRKDILRENVLSYSQYNMQ